jgi:hypothetical protein
MEFVDLLIGLIIGAIISIIISHFYLFKSTQKKIEYEISSVNLITEKISEDISSTPSLKIRYGTEDKPEDVKILTSSIVKIENVGYNEIVYENVSPDDPLRISIKEDNKLYFAKIINTRGTGNRFELVPHDAKYVDILFAFLNRKDGVKIQIFHSGKTSDTVEIHGTIIGGPKIIEKPRWKKNIGAILFVPTITSVLLGFILFFIVPIISQNSAATQFGLIGLAALFFVFLFVLLIAVAELAVLKVYDFCRAKISKDQEW